MKICYIAHPIRGDVQSNVRKIKTFIREVFLIAPQTGEWPFAPYLSNMDVLDDAAENERDIGIAANRPCFDRNFIDELWVCGEPSAGVRLEMEWADLYEIPIIDKRQLFREVLSWSVRRTYEKFAEANMLSDGRPTGAFFQKEKRDGK